MPTYLLLECQQPGCRFRFPVTNRRERTETCPLCQAPVSEVARIEGGSARQLHQPASGNSVAALLDNIRSTYNVGSMFRTADGAGIKHMYLCGITTTPEHPRVGKTALGAEQTVPWTQERNGVDAALALRARGFQLWAIEDTPEAQPLFETATDLGQTPIVMVVGNEITGIDPDILALCD
jgi:23S rRNA (guanosine2251-2'-O)-methyltransferase